MFLYWHIEEAKNEMQACVCETDSVRLTVLDLRLACERVHVQVTSWMMSFFFHFVFWLQLATYFLLRCNHLIDFAHLYRRALELQEVGDSLVLPERGRSLINSILIET